MQATVAALALHALLVLLVLAPALFLTSSMTGLEPARGAGGPGPAGGGGGGDRGAGAQFVPEQVEYLRVPAPKDAIVPPVEEKKPKPEEKKPVEPERPAEVVTPPLESKPAATTDSGTTATAGNAVGSGTDRTAGDGPGSGGGTGSGVGPGRGSANGPGTGGGDELAYPPTVVAFPILPLPVPPKVRPYRMVAEFDVDSLGNARLLGFNPSKDAGYNRRIREMLLEIRFRPAVRVNGRPIRALAVVTAEAM